MTPETKMTFDEIVELYERDAVAFIEEIMRKQRRRFLVVPPRKDGCTLCDVSKAQHATQEHRAYMLQWYLKVHRFVPYEEWARIDWLTEEGLKNVIQWMMDHRIDSTLVQLYRREKFKTQTFKVKGQV
jgi:hypothetical protein